MMLIRLCWLNAAIAFFFPAHPASSPVEFKRADQSIQVFVGDKPFTTYHFESNLAKPFLMPLRTPSGIVVSRSFPLANVISAAERKTDHVEPHQRPLYFGHGDISGLNFWAEEAFSNYYGGASHEAYGRMELAGGAQPLTDAQKATLEARFNLIAPGGRVIGEEQQIFRFGGDEQTRLIDCRFTVQATHGPITFGDSKEGTFAIRLRADLSAPHDHMLNSNGSKGEAAIWGKPADWVSYSGWISGKPVTVSVLDHPESFHHPTTWHARAYGLLAANPFGMREFTNDRQKDGSWTIPEGESLQFKYRVLITDGEQSLPQLNDLYRRYAQER